MFLSFEYENVGRSNNRRSNNTYEPFATLIVTLSTLMTSSVYTCHTKRKRTTRNVRTSSRHDLVFSLSIPYGTCELVALLCERSVKFWCVICKSMTCRRFVTCTPTFILIVELSQVPVFEREVFVTFECAFECWYSSDLLVIRVSDIKWFFCNLNDIVETWKRDMIEILALRARTLRTKSNLSSFLELELDRKLHSYLAWWSNLSRVLVVSSRWFWTSMCTNLCFL